MDIKLIIYDFDGVMTDNMVYVDSRGNEMVRCCRADSIGLDIIRNMGIKQMVMTGEMNSVVEERCKKLSLKCVQVRDKAMHLAFTKGTHEFSGILYVGNDINDLEAMKLCGYSACPSDAHEDVKKECNIILKTKGGHGVVRELADLIKGNREYGARIKEEETITDYIARTKENL